MIFIFRLNYVYALARKLRNFVSDFKPLFCFKVYNLKLKKVIFQQTILNVYNLTYNFRFFRHNFNFLKNFGI